MRCSHEQRLLIRQPYGCHLLPQEKAFYNSAQIRESRFFAKLSFARAGRRGRRPLPIYQFCLCKQPIVVILSGGGFSAVVEGSRYIYAIITGFLDFARNDSLNIVCTSQRGKFFAKLSFEKALSVFCFAKSTSPEGRGFESAQTKEASFLCLFFYEKKDSRGRLSLQYRNKVCTNNKKWQKPFIKRFFAYFLPQRK